MSGRHYEPTQPIPGLIRVTKLEGLLSYDTEGIAHPGYCTCKVLHMQGIGHAGHVQGIACAGIAHADTAQAGQCTCNLCTCSHCTCSH